LNSQIRDRVLYLLLALAIVGSAVAIGIYDADHNLKSDGQMQWFTTGIFTCLVFGFVIKSNRKLWRSPKPLALLLALLIVHIFLVVWCVHLVLAITASRVPVIFYMFISIFEIELLNYIFAKLPKGKRHS
jgi:magnesium-transporting ATPase (P-type)